MKASRKPRNVLNSSSTASSVSSIPMQHVNQSTKRARSSYEPQMGRSDDSNESPISHDPSKLALDTRLDSADRRTLRKKGRRKKRMAERSLEKQHGESNADVIDRKRRKTKHKADSTSVESMPAQYLTPGDLTTDTNRAIRTGSLEDSTYASGSAVSDMQHPQSFGTPTPNRPFLPPVVTSGLEIDTSINGGFKYSSLGKDDIRLLVVHPGQESDSLDCSLVVRKNEPYEALSYVWGKPNYTERIRIRRGDERFDEMHVTPNLHAALKRLRWPSQPRCFWVDAVCINQASRVERNLQVPMMAKIYNGASKVCVWLGHSSKEERDEKTALSLIQIVRILNKYNSVVETGTTCEQWVSLTELMTREWFSRRWVVQEIALAREATLYCPDIAIPWDDFADAVALFIEMADRIRAKFRKAEKYRNHPDFMGEISSLSASKLVKAVSEFVRISPTTDGQCKLEKRASLESLVANMTPFKAKEPHDVVYAVLSLASDVSGSMAEPLTRSQPPSPVEDRSISFPKAQNGTELDERQRKLAGKMISRMRPDKYPVDYEKPFSESCIDFLKFATKRSGSLDMICRPWAPAEAPGPLPSFILTSRLASYGSRPDGFSDRLNADTLVGFPGQRRYNASQNYKGEWKFSMEGGKPLLQVSGFILDVVHETLDAAVSGSIPHEWSTFAGWKNLDEDPPDDFWRTTVGDRDTQGNNTPPYYKTACAQAFKQRVEHGDLLTSQVIDRVNSEIIEKCIKRMQAVVWGRKLTRTLKHGFLGLTPSKPHATREEDLICILGGCSVPVVLRMKDTRDPHTNKRTNYYQFIGECYIHSMMGGEAFTVKKENGIEWEKFDIR